MPAGVAGCGDHSVHTTVLLCALVSEPLHCYMRAGEARVLRVTCEMLPHRGASYWCLISRG
jgi:hypothetical protein